MTEKFLVSLQYTAPNPLFTEVRIVSKKEMESLAWLEDCCYTMACLGNFGALWQAFAIDNGLLEWVEWFREKV